METTAQPRIVYNDTNLFEILKNRIGFLNTP